MRAGTRNLITDVPGLLVGQAGDGRLKSGVTVLTAARPFVAAVAVMGGAPASHETDLLAPGRLVEEVDALVLSGGSAFGLAATQGVMEGLLARGRGFPVGPVRVPIVPGAAVFDLLNGGDKGWAANPYPALGRAALEAALDEADNGAGGAAGETFTLGTAGGGTGALTRGLKGGVGSASAVLARGFTVGALAVVNAMGSAVAGADGQFWAAPWEFGAEFGGLGPAPHTDPGAEPLPTKAPGEATTIAIVATDAALTRAQALRLAIAAQDGLGRALVPAHTLLDGDLVFAAATGARPLTDRAADEFALGHAAATTLARAIARAVYLARAEPGDLFPTWSQRFDR